MTTRHRRELRTKLAELELALAHEPRLASLERARQLSAAARELADPSLLADVLLVHAELLARSGESRDAAEVLHEALTTAATANDLHTEARAALALADQIEDLDDARRWLELGAALASTLAERRSLDTRVHLGRAALARREGQLERARAELGAARETLESDGDPSQLLPEVLRALAEVSAELGDRDDAVALLRRALVLSETAHGPNHPRVAELRRELAGALAELGEFDAALGEFERSLATFEQTRGPGPDTVRVRSEIGALLARRGRCDEAWAPLAAAVADAHQTLAPGSLVHARALEAQALACDFGHPEASALARAAVEIRIQRQAQGHPELIASQAILTLARLTRGEIDAKDALSALDEATRSDAFSNDALAAPDEATRSDAFAAPHEQALLDAARGLILAELERSDEARALLERALTGLEPSSALILRVKQGLERLEPQPAYNPRDDGRDRGR